MASRKRSRSSAFLMTSGLAPIISTPYFSRMPVSATAMAEFRPVWPPRVGRRASGRSRSMTWHDHLRGDGLDIGAVGHLRVGHDGGRVGVDQDHLIAFFPQGLAGLGAGIVKLAGLADDDGAGADDQDFLNVGAFGHISLIIRAPARTVIPALPQCSFPLSVTLKAPSPAQLCGFIYLSRLGPVRCPGR